MLVKAKKFSNISFDSISKSRCSNLSLHHDTQPMKVAFGLMDEDYEVYSGSLSPKFHHPSEILRKVDPFLFCKLERSFHCKDAQILNSRYTIKIES
jgi:hypothetical protein